MASNTKQCVLITGCSKDGIGDALAREFLSRGFRVFATARDLRKIEHLKELGCDILALDVTDEKSIRKAAESVWGETGGVLHYLINNAGMTYRATILDTDMTVFKQVFDVKVFGTVAVTKAFAPLLLDAKGTIVNIGSMSTYFYCPINGVYAGANSALEYISHSMRPELEPFGVSVVHVVGGGVCSNLSTNRPLQAMPSNSLYYPIRAYIDKAANPTWTFMPTPVFASKLVSKLLLTKKPAMMYIGAGFGLAYVLYFVAWCASWFMGVRFWDLVVSKPFGMVELKKIVKERERESNRKVKGG